MAKSTSEQRAAVRALQKSGALSPAEAQRRQEAIDRRELADRAKTRPTAR